MANYLLIRHNCRSFAEWKPAYDAHLASRQAAGLTQKYVLQSTQDPTEVVILFEVADPGKAKAMSESADLREAMQKAGVVGKPDMYFLHG